MTYKKKLWRIGGTLLLIGAVLVTSGCDAQKSVKTGSIAKKVQGANSVIEAAGKIKANDVKNIMLDFSASIQKVYVKDGQRVKQGEQLIALDLKDIKQQITNKENDLAKGNLQIQISLNDINAYESQLGQDKAQYDREKNNNSGIQLKEKDYQYALELLNRENTDLQKKQSLYESSSISRSELDAEQRKYEDIQKTVNDKKLVLDDANNTRQQTLDKLQMGITQEESKLNDLRLNVEIQKQSLSTLESDIKQLKDKLNKTYISGDKIISDVKNGMVQEVSHVSGDYIAPNTKLFNLVNMDSLIVEADVSEDFIKDVKLGAQVEIMPLSDSSKVYKGHVLKIADMGVQKNGETFVTTQISIDNADQYIKPDFSVDVKIAK